MVVDLVLVPVGQANLRALLELTEETALEGPFFLDGRQRPMSGRPVIRT